MPRDSLRDSLPDEEIEAIRAHALAAARTYAVEATSIQTVDDATTE
jgi:hypothetical protein